jgi:hypothetical protein
MIQVTVVGSKHFGHYRNLQPLRIPLKLENVYRICLIGHRNCEI